MSSIRVAILGASGYSGIELVTVLSRHPGVSLGPLFAQSSAGKRVDELYPFLRGRVDAVFQTYAPGAVDSCEAVFIALPSGEAMNVVPELLQNGKRVIDLGGDFRLQDPSVYARFYKREHAAKELLAKAVYGFPEWNPLEIRQADLVSNPGCYPTSAILPLAPLIKKGLIRAHGVVINALSGVSGAGRSAAADLSFAEVNESVRAYKVGIHQHIPEIEMALTRLGGADTSVTFIPHLLPITRGILATIVAPLEGNPRMDDVLKAYEEQYAHAPFVRLLGDTPPQIGAVQHTNYIDIGWKVYEEKRQVIIMSAIDNLVKGAAGQAVQNFNLMFGLPETEGLL